ncbi:MAG: type I-F CRISPR-associated endoribonuclease Cas6/Csy4 [Pigmentiphaga sp.]|nr:type I-F CRISPR-associated endoribonuclease Cas6/Csy4 [Pigmentiphaga sp.]
MTTHFIDIRLLPDPEFAQTHLLGALYAKLHRTLVQLDASDIGVSFPRYCLQPRSLGDVLRLHGHEGALQRLLATDWLRGMRDHTELTPVAAVPLQTEHRRLQRCQFKTNAERLRRRRARRKGETMEELREIIPDHVERRPDLPYVRLRSRSTAQAFCLFLRLSEPQAEAVEGEFNTYGLSSTATVPWF